MNKEMLTIRDILTKRINRATNIKDKKSFHIRAIETWRRDRNALEYSPSKEKMQVLIDMYLTPKS